MAGGSCRNSCMFLFPIIHLRWIEFNRPTGRASGASRPVLNLCAPAGRGLSPHVAFIVFDLVTTQKFQVFGLEILFLVMSALILDMIEERCVGIGHDSFSFTIAEMIYHREV